MNKKSFEFALQKQTNKKTQKKRKNATTTTTPKSSLRSRDHLCWLLYFWFVKKHNKNNKKPSKEWGEWAKTTGVFKKKIDFYSVRRPEPAKSPPPPPPSSATLFAMFVHHLTASLPKEGTHSTMHVTASLAGHDEVDVEVGEDCRTLQALKQRVAAAMPQLCVEVGEFDVSIGGRALADDGAVSLEESAYLDVALNTRGVSARTLREAGHAIGERGLYAFVQQGKLELCTLYLDAGVPPDCVFDLDDHEEVRWRPLHLASARGRLHVSKLLLDRGCAIDQKSGDNDTPLHLSCEHGHLEVCTFLLDQGSSAINAKGYCGKRPLHYACAGGNLDLCTLLLDRGSAMRDEENPPSSSPPLHLASGFGHADVCALLLDRGCDVDVRSGTGHTALHVACAFEHFNVCTLLLSRGCEVELETIIATTFSNNLADVMPRPCTEKVLAYLSERGYDVQPHLAARDKAQSEVNNLCRSS